MDILLTHDAPAGVAFTAHRRGPYVSAATGLDELLQRAQPLICFFGHHHARVRAELNGVPCIGLNYVGRPGNLVAIEVGAGRQRLMGEWPSEAASRNDG